MELIERLAHIRSSPKLENQQQTAVLLSAVEDTLRDQASEITPTAYFAALLSLLNQYGSSSDGAFNHDVATAVVYLLNLVTPSVPPQLLRLKFAPIFTKMGPALTDPDATAAFLRPAIGCLVSLLVVQDSQAWALPQSEISPRRAVSGLLMLAHDPRPKVRKCAQDGLVQILQNGPPSPALDHPAAQMCAESVLQHFAHTSTLFTADNRENSNTDQSQQDSEVIHALKLLKAVASASGGWPSRSLDPLCDVLLRITRSNNQFLNMAVFDVFELIFGHMAEDQAQSKLPRLLGIVSDLQPAMDDSQLFPPWSAMISRGFDVAAQVDPSGTFQKLPNIFARISTFLLSSSYNIRVSASECLASFLVNCIPDTVILDPSVFDEKMLQQLAKTVNGFFDFKYQSAWMEVFNVIGAVFNALKWRSLPLLAPSLSTLGDLRATNSFTGKRQADQIIGIAIAAAGPEKVLQLLPLNLANPGPKQQGRAWMIPIIRDFVANTHLGHFKREMIPLSEILHNRTANCDTKEKSVEVKIFETLIHQIWSTLPGYCDRPLDLHETFDQDFAQLLSNLLYQQPDLRNSICKALQMAAVSAKARVDVAERTLLEVEISEDHARQDLECLSSFAPNILAVLFNIYSKTAPQQRGSILACIDAYLAITHEAGLIDTFDRVVAMVESLIKESAEEKSRGSSKSNNFQESSVAQSHSLMDIMVAMALYLPKTSFPTLLKVSANIILHSKDAQLQKKAYKLVPRLAHSEAGKEALRERNTEVQQMFLSSADNLASAAKRDRLLAISSIVDFMASDQLHFIPSILAEVVLCTKEVNEKARIAAFDVLIQMGVKMGAGGVVKNSMIDTMPENAPTVIASIEEYFTMLSAGLAGSTPHMVSASITAIARALFHFRNSLSASSTVDLVQTMDLFLSSPNREIVRSVLGFVKVCVTSLPTELMLPRLQTIVPNLMAWSHEHKAHFRAKVKNIIERIMRRFGVELVQRYCPEEDRKLITNIRKARERRKRKNIAGSTADGHEASVAREPNTGTTSIFETEFDEVIHGSDGTSSDSEPDLEESMGRRYQKGEKTFIIENEDPLDLLDRKIMSKISSVKPHHARDKKIAKVKRDLDGKLVFREEEGDDNIPMQDANDGAAPDAEDETLRGGINAYVEAIRGRNAAQRGQRGRLKFSNKRGQHGDDGDTGGDDRERPKSSHTSPKRFKTRPRGFGVVKQRDSRFSKGSRGNPMRS